MVLGRDACDDVFKGHEDSGILRHLQDLFHLGSGQVPVTAHKNGKTGLELKLEWYVWLDEHLEHDVTFEVLAVDGQWKIGRRWSVNGSFDTKIDKDGTPHYSCIG